MTSNKTNKTKELSEVEVLRQQLEAEMQKRKEAEAEAEKLKQQQQNKRQKNAELDFVYINDDNTNTNRAKNITFSNTIIKYLNNCCAKFELKVINMKIARVFIEAKIENIADDNIIKKRINDVVKSMHRDNKEKRDELINVLLKEQNIYLND